MTEQIEVRLRLAWWVMLYIDFLAFCCALFDREPDYDKLGEKLMRWGIKVDS